MLHFFKGTITPRDWINVVVSLAVSIALAVAFFFFIVIPLQEKNAKQQVDLRKIQVQLNEARKLKEDIGRHRQDAEKWGKVVDLFQERLPEEREIPRLLEKFENLGSDIGLSVELSQMNPERDTNKETIPYKVVARGDFHQIVTFINLLEREQRYLKISDLNIGPEENGVSETSFTLSTFQFLESTSTMEEAKS